MLEFYPKFGFVPAREHVCTLPLPARDAAPAEGGFARLDMDTQAGRALLLRCYERSNPFSALPMLDNPGLLMFYCSGFLKDCVYYSSAYDLACVATEEDGVFTCCDFFGTGRCTLEQAVCAAASAASPGATRAELGFTPASAAAYARAPVQGDDHLFVLAGGANIFAEDRVMLPLLSHA